jgi:hypothetical protein
VLRGHPAIISGVTVSPDGVRFATASEGRRHHKTVGRNQRRGGSHPLRPQSAGVGVAFSPGGRLLATSSAERTAALHFLPIDEPVTVACERVNRNHSDAECAASATARPAPLPPIRDRRVGVSSSRFSVAQHGCAAGRLGTTDPECEGPPSIQLQAKRNTDRRRRTDDHKAPVSQADRWMTRGSS